MVESTKRNSELVNEVKNLQKKVEESKKINENLEMKRKQESLKYYLEEKISKYPKYEADLLRKHFQNANSKAEIDENFNKALGMVQEKSQQMRTVQAIPVSKVVPQQQPVENNNKKISGGTIVKESGGTDTTPDESMFDESFVDIDNDVISNDEMATWLSRL